MAFNFGAFLGGAAKAGVQTYQMLSEEEERELIKEELRDRRDRAKQFRAITAEELGRVGKQPGYEATGAIREAAGIKPEEVEQTAIPGPSLSQAAGVKEGISSVGTQSTAIPVSANPVTREDAMAKIFERGMSVDPDKAFDLAIKGMDLEDKLGSNKQKREFRAWQNNFNTELGKLQVLEARSTSDPDAFIAEAKKLGVDVRPVSLGEGKTAFETFYRGNKIGQYDSLSSAAADGISMYTTNMITQGVAKFANSPEQFVNILSTMDRMNLERRRVGMDQERLGMEHQRLEMELKTNPAKIDQIRASINASNAAARESNLKADKLRDIQSMNAQMEELLKNPKENASAILQLASRMELRFPDIYTRTGTVKDSEGNQTQVTTGILGNVAKGSLKAAGVAILPTQSLPILRDAAAAAKGDSKKFLASQAAKAAIGLGATPEDLIKDFMPQAAPTKQPQSAIPAPSTTNSTKTSSSVAPSGRGATVTPNIPPPPPRTIQQQSRGGIVDTGRPNPEYEAWERKYGRYQTQ